MGLRTCISALLLSASLLSISPPAAAWNAAGHRLSAAIAWRHMDTPTREAVGTLLAQHPDYTTWLTRSSSQQPAYTAFLEASTWPDDIKRDRRFHDADEPPTPQMPGFSDMGRHRDWHYVDAAPDSDTSREHGSGELDIRLDRLMRNLATRHEADSQNAIALAWLIHLLADAHQPLHTMSHYDENGRSDEGGNGLWIENPFHPRRSSMTLHTYWDDLPGPPWLRGERLEAAADALERWPDTSLRRNEPGTSKRWIAESRALANASAYGSLEGETPVLSADYHERALKIARERVALAGKRLGLLLERLFRPR